MNNFDYFNIQEGLVYAVEFSHRSGRDLINVAKKRTNIIPIIEDARHPHKYRMLMGMVDTIFADVAQPDQARIVALNAQYFLKNGGHFVISIKVCFYFFFFRTCTYIVYILYNAYNNFFYYYFRQVAQIRLPNRKQFLHRK